MAVSTIQLARRLIRDHGAVAAARMVARKWGRKLRRKPLPNTTYANLERWTVYDWSRLGEEWTPSDVWKAAIVAHLLDPNVPSGSRVLEIGPGAGRWTTHLADRASHLVVVDLTPACIDACKERFRDRSNIEYHVNDGRDLSFLAPASIDRIWSFDVFVHIQPCDVEHYVKQFAEILVAGGVAVIHHSKRGAYKTGWRSAMTAETMVEIAVRFGLQVVQQLDAVDAGRVPVYQAPNRADPDIVTILEARPETLDLGSIGRIRRVNICLGIHRRHPCGHPVATGIRPLVR